MLACNILLAQPEAELRFYPTLDCDKNLLQVELQIRAHGEEEFNIGTSSLYFTYNQEAIQFVEYSSQHFDEKSTCIGGVASSWDKQAFDAYSRPGHFNLTLLLKTENYGCPRVSSEEWLSIGTAKFEIVNKKLSPEVFFDLRNTHFNEHSLDDGNSHIDPEEIWGLRGSLLDCEDGSKLKVRDFKASRRESSIALIWELDEAPMGSKMILERAFDNGAFEAVRTFEVLPEWKGQLMDHTDELDAAKPSKEVSYRFKIAQTDGSSTYTEERRLALLDAGKLDMAIRPNPASEQFSIDFALPESGAFALEVYNIWGQNMISTFSRSKDSFGNVDVDSRDWTPGIYIVKIQYDNHSRVSSIVIQ